MQAALDRSRPIALIIALVALGLASGLDIWSRSFAPATLLYIPAVVLIAWHAGAWSGIAVCVLIAGLHGFATAGASSEEQAGPAIDQVAAPLALFGFLVVIAVLARSLRISRLRERQTGRTDALTGIANRKAFFEAAAAELNRSRRWGHALSVAYIDCDQFKAFNDALGHLAGDALLKKIAVTLHDSVRNYDLVARVGGDEFAVLLPDTPAGVSQAVTERLQARLQAGTQDLGREVTFSIGVASFADLPESVEELLRAADQAMYAVKRSGKDGLQTRVVDKAAQP